MKRHIGIVANEIYDPILKDIATIPTMNDTKWWYVKFD